MKQQIDEVAAREAFERFLFEMDGRIEGLQQAAAERGLSLDLSIASLDELERFCEMELEQSADPKSLMVTCGRYLGEVMLLEYGGKWKLALSDPRNVNFNQPVIVGHNTFGTDFAPISLARAFVLKKQRGTFLRAINGQISPEPLDLSDLIAKEKRGAKS